MSEETQPEEKQRRCLNPGRSRFHSRYLACGARALFRVACAALALTASSVASAAPNVAVLVEPPPSPIQPGQEIVYRIHVSNLDPVTATGPLLISVDIPQNMSAAQSPWGGKCSPKSCGGSNVARFGNTINWDLSLAAGKTHSWSVPLGVDNDAKYPPPADGASIPFEVVVKSGATKAAGSTATVVAQHGAAAFDLAVDGAARVAPGQESEYTFRYGNSTSAAQNATLVLPVPAGASVIAASRGAVRKGGSIEWALGSVAAGHSDFRAVRLRFDDKTRPGSLSLLQPELRTSGVEPVRSPLAVHVAPPTVALAVKATPDPVGPGGTVLYKLELTNLSATAPTGALNVYASIPTDGHVAKPAGAKCFPGSCSGSNSARHGSFVHWEVPSLQPKATAPLQFAFVVDEPSNAAPPPNGSLLMTHFGSELGIDTRFTVALGTAATVGKGTPLEPLGAGSAPAAKPLPPPVAAPPPPAAPAPLPAPEPVATPTEPEPPVDEIPEEEVIAELPAADDEPALPAAEVKARHSWKTIDWDKYCDKRWKSRGWDRHCAKRWWKRHDWNQFCKAERGKHSGWKKFCARDFVRWKFVEKNRHKWGRGKARDDKARAKR